MLAVLAVNGMPASVICNQLVLSIGGCGAAWLDSFGGLGGLGGLGGGQQAGVALVQLKQKGHALGIAGVVFLPPHSWYRHVFLT